jgi:signal peptidase I
MGRALRRVADTALSVGAVLGLAALLLVALGAWSGVRPLVFRSGSMAPTIDTGALALAHRVAATDLRVGDVVSVRTGSGARVTHRVVGIDLSSRTASLTLKGDANEVADAETYVVGSAYRVFWHVPWVGYAARAVVTPAVLWLLSLGAVVLLLRTRSGRGSGGGRRARRAPAGRHRARRAGATAVATMAVLAGPAGPAGAAAWTDPVAISGSTFTAGTVPPPAFDCFAVNVLSVTFAWTAVSGATSYTVHYGSGGSQTASTTNTSYTTVSVISGGTAWVVANRNYGSTTWSSVASNTRSYTVAVLGFCG